MGHMSISDKVAIASLILSVIVLVVVPTVASLVNSFIERREQKEFRKDVREFMTDSGQKFKAHEEKHFKHEGEIELVKEKVRGHEEDIRDIRHSINRTTFREG